MTPLVSIFRHAARAAPDTEVLLVHSVVHSEELLFHHELETVAETYAASRYVPTVTGEEPGWKGETGRIDTALLERHVAPLDARYYFCGARDFIETMHALLVERGVPEDRQVFEKWW